MDVSYLDKDVKCPFFKSVNFHARQIVCEGVDGAAHKRSEAGKKGMASRWSKDNKNNKNNCVIGVITSHNKNNLNDNDNDNENVFINECITTHTRAYDDFDDYNPADLVIGLERR